MAGSPEKSELALAFMFHCDLVNVTSSHSVHYVITTRGNENKDGIQVFQCFMQIYLAKQQNVLSSHDDEIFVF